ncbi:MAG TPA: LacI family DNA-binding transcriptional regulator [Roseiflexaceae bacterium]
MATMADIAERAGVALSTVSYVLSGKRSVSEETKQRVFRAIAELDYQPNALARGLASRRTRTIGLVFPSLTKGHSEMRMEFVARAAEVAAEHGYAFLLWTAPDSDLELLQLTQQGRVDGLILMEIRLHDSRVDLLKERKYPFTMIGRCQDNDGISFVDLDFEHAVATAVAHLAELGHRQIVLLNHSAELLEVGYGPSVRSLQGFERAVGQHGIAGVAVTSEPSAQSGYAVTQALLAQHPDLSAAIVPQETALVGMIRALNDAGLRVPDDFSIVTLLSARQAELVTPALTSVDFPADEMGRIGAELLIQQLEGQIDRPIQRLLRANLTVRHSSGAYYARSR